jgi:DNA adenine methylase
VRTFLRWAGSKKQLLPVLAEYWPHSFSRYIEPFAGSCCLFFHIEPPKAILGDINAELIHALRAIKRDPARVIESLNRLKKTKASYYRVRSIDPTNLGLFEAAARFLFLNSLCFNGLYRTNGDGQFNVPYCPPGHSTVPEHLILDAHIRLRSATLIQGDFEATIATAGKGDLVYLDPPYAMATRRVFSEYGPKPFSSVDLVRLDKCLKKIDRRGAKFVVSYADSQETRKRFSAWSLRRVRVRRNIAGFTGNRRGCYEVLVTNIES